MSTLQLLAHVRKQIKASRQRPERSILHIHKIGPQTENIPHTKTDTYEAKFLASIFSEKCFQPMRMQFLINPPCKCMNYTTDRCGTCSNRKKVFQRACHFSSANKVIYWHVTWETRSVVAYLYYGDKSQMATLYMVSGVLENFTKYINWNWLVKSMEDNNHNHYLLRIKSDRNLWEISFPNRS